MLTAEHKQQLHALRQWAIRQGQSKTPIPLPTKQEAPKPDAETLPRGS